MSIYFNWNQQTEGTAGTGTTKIVPKIYFTVIYKNPEKTKINAKSEKN